MFRSVRSTMLLCLGLALPTFAQAPPSTVATVTASAQPVSVAPGGKGVLRVSVAVKPQFHINANKPNDPDLIPTVFSGSAPAGITFGAPHYPATKSLSVSYEKKPMLVYQGQATIFVPFTVSKSAKPGRRAVNATLAYQGCNASSCFPPMSSPVHATVTVK